MATFDFPLLVPSMLPQASSTHSPDTSEPILEDLLPRRKPAQDLNYRVQCPGCHNPVPNFLEDYTSGDLICRDCGAVVMDRMIDMRSEWRNFSNDNTGGDDPSRVGGPSNPLFMAENADGTSSDFAVESTMISTKDGGSGASRDLNKAHAKTALRYNEKSLLKVFNDISAMSERIGLPKMVADRAKAIFKKVDDEKLLRGKTTESIVAASVYIACRLEGVPRTFREISSLTLVPKKDIGRCFKIVATTFFPMANQSVSYNNPKVFSPVVETAIGSRSKLGSTNASFGTVSVQDFMARFCSLLTLPMDVQKLSVIVCQRAQELGCLAGKSPISIAAAAIYMATQLFPDHSFRRSQKDIAYVTGVSEITIKNTYKDLYQYRYDIAGDDLVNNMDALMSI